MLADAVCKAKLLNDFGFFVRYFFKAQYNKRFMVAGHHGQIIDALTRVVSGETTRLIINIPPRYGKTEIAVKMFVAWCLANSPAAKFIHLSYSDDLALDNSSAIRDVVKSSEFQRFFPMALRADSDSKKKWFTENAGGLYATAAGGAITGFGAGGMGRTRSGTGSPADGFAGCFPYDEVVSTELGLMKIGDIVSKRINVRVHSFNFATGKTELQQIDVFFTNPPNDIIRVHFSDGSSLECTPNHEIFTASGWVEASSLTADHSIPFLFSDVLELRHGNAKFSANFVPWLASVKSGIDNLLSCFWLEVPCWVRKVGGNRGPRLPHLDLPDNSIANAVPGLQCRCGLAAGEDGNHLISGEFGSRPTLKDGERTMLERILHVVGLGPVCQVVKSVVSVVPVAVSAFLAFCSGSYKRLKNCLVDVFEGDNAFDRAANSEVPMGVGLWLQNLFRLPVLRTISTNKPTLTPGAPKVADFVGGLVSRDRFPVFIERVGHVDSTYCLEVGCNHNFYSGKSQVLVSNCILIDDPVKPDDAFSDTMRDRINRRFNNTIASRTNSPETPIIVIMQRLHENDMTGFLLAGGSGEKWDHLCIPAITEDRDALWPEKHSIDALRVMEDADPYTFAGQYMQRPSPLAGGILKPDNIQIIDALPVGPIEWVRGWDFASTTTGDYTAGGKLGKLPDGRLVIGDMVRIRVGPDERDAALKNTCARDGTNCRASIPQDPGQAGLTQVKYLVRQLAGYTVRATPESGNKVVRCEPFAAQVNVGNVLMLKADWNDALISEMRMFPNGTFDDQVDSLSRAFAMLIGTNQVEVFWGGGEQSLNDRQKSVAASMPGLPGGVMQVLGDLPAGEICGRCYNFDQAAGHCGTRNFIVQPKDPGCHIFIPIES